MRESISVLQVMCTVSECAMKLKGRMMKSLYLKKCHLFVAVGIVTRDARNKQQQQTCGFLRYIAQCCFSIGFVFLVIEILLV